MTSSSSETYAIKNWNHCNNKCFFSKTAHLMASDNTVPIVNYSTTNQKNLPLKNISIIKYMIKADPITHIFKVRIYCIMVKVGGPPYKLCCNLVTPLTSGGKNIY